MTLFSTKSAKTVALANPNKKKQTLAGYYIALGN